MDYPKSVPGVGLVDGRFVNEDPATGQLGSIIPAEWGNALMSELFSVMAKRGVTPDETKFNQLAEVIFGLATVNAAGMVQLASAAEAAAGTNAAKVITPVLLKQETDKRAALSHTQAISTITGLSAALDGLSAAAASKVPLDRIQSNWLDVVVGKLMTVGAFGIGAAPAARIADMNDAMTPGFYACSGGAANVPVTGDGAVIVLRDAYPSGRVVQIYITFGVRQIFFRTIQDSSFGDWIFVPTANSHLVWWSSNSGYERAYGGMLYQWGVSAAINYNQYVDITLPLAAPNSIMNVQATLECTISNTNGAHSAYAEIISNSVIRLHHDDTMGESRPLRIFWRAVCR